MDGQNIKIEYRSAEEKRERLLELAVELARLDVRVIVTAGPPAPEAARKATRTIPVVFAVIADPVAEGLVTSLHRPGGNFTGLTSMSPDLVGKQLDLLKAVVPRLVNVAVLSNPDNRGHATQLQYAKAAAKTLGLILTVFEANSAGALDGAFRRIAPAHVGGAVVLPDGPFLRHRTRIVDRATEAALPSVFGHREEAEAGALMSYGTDSVALFRRAHKALGLKIPPSVLQRADQVIE